MTDTQPPPTGGGLRALLTLQELDTRIDHLRHQRDHLSEHAQLDVIRSRATLLRPELTDAVQRKDEHEAKRLALEAEVQTIEARVAAINERLYGVSTVGARDAPAMTHEISQLNERRDKLEDQELELMEYLDTLTTEVTRLQSDAQGLASEMREVSEKIERTQRSIDDQLQALVEEKSGIESAVTTDLLKEYERLRPGLDGVAVAPLVGTNCGGCHLTIAASELDRIRKAPPGDLVYCEECGRILVR